MLRIINRIAEYLSNEIVEVPTKATPEAVGAPQFYDMTEAQGIILLWLDSVPNYVDPNKKLESDDFRTHIYQRSMLLILSIGMKTVGGSPKLDELVEKIEQKLVHLKVGDFSPLRPVSISKIMIDGNNVFWRQMIFETRQKIVGHPVSISL
ncbi:hypothetical protein D9V84_11150 [Bacteroidetes/Chlorobi group bacterium Naka2016]|jgi:hypothetical protein|nr:MAG: hypothetical protein D9V84_11150 [Bacteroidetes/Chlorobi group bacterium Naka2016]